MTKRFMLSLVFVVALGIVIGGAFSGGVVFGKSQGEQTISTQQTTQIHQQSESEFSGGLTGVIENIEGNTVRIVTHQGPLLATLISDTSIGRFTEVSSADLQTGMQVTIVGQIGADSGVEARSILLNPDEAIGFFGRGFFSGNRQQPVRNSGGDAGADRQEHTPGGGGNFFGGGVFSGQHQP